MQVEQELANLREQNRQLIAENERRSAEVAWMRSAISRIQRCSLDENSCDGESGYCTAYVKPDASGWLVMWDELTAMFNLEMSQSVIHDDAIESPSSPSDSATP